MAAKKRPTTAKRAAKKPAKNARPATAKRVVRQRYLDQDDIQEQSTRNYEKSGKRIDQLKARFGGGWRLAARTDATMVKLRAERVQLNKKMKARHMKTTGSGGSSGH